MAEAVEGVVVEAAVAVACALDSSSTCDDYGCYDYDDDCDYDVCCDDRSI